MTPKGARHVRLPWTCPDDPFFLQLETDGAHAAAVDIFRDVGSRTDLKLRVTFHETDLRASMTWDFDVTASDLRQFAQFILRRLNSEVPSRSAPVKRLYEGNNAQRQTDYNRLGSREGSV